MPETTYEMLAREKKARKLANWLIDEGISAAEARTLKAWQWMQVAHRTNCHTPSQATKDLVIRMLEEAGEKP